ncbi:hypothetical protein Tel_16810 (plasmid) [Candidatus Tenderia electrophaga]|jgi:hypothetical protein|uniref:Uncharacterized protein n=1 Tax=Candidatus Tenderia electrophaga TaxID=1748243 RepID=A0A0S2TIB3_9GAMM|nr:hypothetical protein Tel_16810 [Candidatus Tenderia electrophaga]
MSNGVQRTTIEKLLKISETQDAAIIEKLAKEEFGDLFQELVESGILTHFKILKSVEVFDGDCEFFADIQRRDGKNMYFSAADGWVAVNDEDINLYQVNFEWLLRRVMDALDIADRHTPKVILEGKIWALGQHRIEKQNTNILVVRDMKSGVVLDALKNYLKIHHKSSNPALVIALDQNLPDHLELPNQNQLGRLNEAIKWDKDDFELNTFLLAGKMGGSISQDGFSGGFRSLVVNGKQYQFTKKQAEAVEFLYNAGGARHQDEILAEINSTQSKLLQVFRSRGKTNQAWGEVIKNDGKGNYRLEL